MLVVGEIYTCRILSYCDDQLGVNVLHYKVTEATPINDYTAEHVAGILSAKIAADMKALLVARADYLGVEAAAWGPIPGAPFFSGSGANPGQAAGDAMSRQTAGILTKKTLLAGRRKRGRMYIPFPAESQNDPAGHPTVAYQTLLQNLGDNLASDLVIAGHGVATATMRLGVLSMVGLPSIELVHTMVARRKWANQRRRGDYGRPNLRP